VRQSETARLAEKIVGRIVQYSGFGAGALGPRVVGGVGGATGSALFGGLDVAGAAS